MSASNYKRIIIGGLLSVLPLVYFFPFDPSPMIEIDRKLPRYEMLDEEGKKAYIQDFLNGKQTLIYFGYLNCKTFCLGSIAKLKEILEIKRNFQLIFISLDPENDKPSRLKTLFEKSESRAILLRGSSQTYSLVVALDLGMKLSKNIDSEEIEHQDSLIWVSPDNSIKGIFPEFQNSYNKNPKKFIEFLNKMDEGDEQ
ncbi:SCO family protein [Leptospira semungkisensis]|uniref:SCO family protein n=1 Tax=Leptospira semungkisensis TaxID=2484985 RepID=A0A4R9FLU4_9LEPT|nr:SCO family protein [Leptospira semungkisensis]TGJ99557.1 SCO family protein [Leptospira semungkisensis]